MKNKTDTNILKLKEKLNALSNTQYKKIINLLESINLNLGTPSTEINKKLIDQVKETLRINNNEFLTLIKIYKIKLNESEKNKT